jgi:4-amino-4-deoxy-L-arabinose transferase-like glycosyltransferase
MEAPPRPAWRTVALLWGLAGAHGLAVALWTATIASDASYYLRAAEMYARGETGRALEYSGLHPFYPILVAFLGKAVGSFEAAAYAVSVLGTSFGVVPLFFLTRSLWNERVAAWTGFLFALHPLLGLEGFEALPTGFSIALFVGSISAGILALRGGPWALYPLSGLGAALAYLTRSEGIVAVPVLLAGAVVSALGHRARRRADPSHRPPWLALAGGTLAAALAFAGAAAPYVAALSARKGRLSFTAKPAPAAFLKKVIGTPSETPGLSEPGSAPSLPTVAKRLSKAFFWPLFPFLAVGLAGAGRLGGGWRSLAAFPACGAAALAPPAALFVLNGYVPSHRYFLPAVVFFLPFVAAGFLIAADACRRRCEGRLSPGAVQAIAGALLAVLLLGKSLGPRRTDEISFREAGAWLRERSGGRALGILATNDKPVWYGGGDPLGTIPETGNLGWKSLPAPEAARQTVERARRLKADYLVLDEEGVEAARSEDFIRTAVGEGMVLEAAFPREGRPHALLVWVLRVP